MAKMPDLFHEAEEAVFGHLHHHTARIIEIPQDELRNQRSMAAWAAASATMKAATAAAPQQEETMSLETFEEDFGKGVDDVEADVAAALGKFRASVPGFIAEAKTLAASPIGKLALTAAGHVASNILPAGAIAYLAANWEADLNGLVGLYNPPAESAAPADAQQPVQQGASAQ